MLKRDPDFIKQQLQIKDNKIYTKKRLTIEFPKWYMDKELASIQEISYIYGVFAMIVDDKYSVSLIPTLIPTAPIMVTEVEKGGVAYTQFVYGPNDCVIDSVSVIKHELLSYNFFETFFMQAREPWFIEYLDLIKIMDNLVPYAGSNVGGNHISSELVVSFISRVKEDKKKFYRQGNHGDIEYVDLMNVYYSTRGLNTLSGNYFTESLTSAIVNPSKDVTKLESLVR